MLEKRALFFAFSAQRLGNFKRANLNSEPNFVVCFGACFACFVCLENCSYLERASNNFRTICLAANLQTALQNIAPAKQARSSLNQRNIVLMQSQQQTQFAPFSQFQLCFVFFYYLFARKIQRLISAQFALCAPLCKHCIFFRSSLLSFFFAFGATLLCRNAQKSIDKFICFNATTQKSLATRNLIHQTNNPI